jgi:hypothetical protein
MLRRRWHSGGTFAAEATPFGTLTQSSASPGITWLSGIAVFSAAAKQTGSDPTLWWARSLSTASIREFDSTDKDLIGQLTEGTFREDTTQNRVFWITPHEYPTALDGGSSPHVSYRRSSDGFDTSSWGNLKECTTMTGFMTCSSSEYIQSSKEPAIAWAPSVSRSIFAWVNQNRQNDTDQREIRIAVGYVNQYTLPVATGTGMQSNVGPGIACSTGNANGYDCLMAYVPQSDGGHYIRLRRFTPAAGKERHTLSWDSTATTFNVSTASRIAVWYHDAKWWLAYRSSNSNQNVFVRSSTDSVTWSDSSLLAYSDVGPTAIAYWTLNNNLFYVN